MYKLSIRDHIIPFLIDAHWLPVTSRITFKLLTLVYKPICDETPKKLPEYVLHYFLTYTPYASKSVAYMALKSWNVLPLEKKM